MPLSVRSPRCLCLYLCFILVLIQGKAVYIPLFRVIAVLGSAQLLVVTDFHEVLAREQTVIGVLTLIHNMGLYIKNLQRRQIKSLKCCESGSSNSVSAELANAEESTYTQVVVHILFHFFLQTLFGNSFLCRVMCTAPSYSSNTCTGLKALFFAYVFWRLLDEFYFYYKEVVNSILLNKHSCA